MQFLIKPFMQYVVYPAASALAAWALKKFMVYQTESEKKENDKQKASLNKAIKNAENDEDILNLSIVLRKLDKL